MINVTYKKEILVDGETYNSIEQVNPAQSSKVSVAADAALSGTLTVRTDNTSGTLTMPADHGIVTGSRISLKFTLNGADARRINALVGTVSGTSVPFSVGDGANLPTQGSTVIVAKVVSYDLPLNGDELVAILTKVTAPGDCSLYDASLGQLYSTTFYGSTGGSESTFVVDNGGQAILPGETVATVKFSNFSLVGTNTMKINVLYNSLT